MTRSKSTVWILLSLMLLLASCGGGKSQKAAEVPAPTATVELSIEGMTCTGCENTICANLEKLPGVKSVTASHTGGNAIIEYDPGKVDTIKMKETVDGLGYKAVKTSAVAPGGND
jgi:copper chaperone CopZ